MLICGLKLTHDGAIAVIRDSALLFSIEIEKLNNNPRYSSMEDTGLIETILNQEGIAVEDIDLFAVDGWGGFDEWDWQRQDQLTLGSPTHALRMFDQGREFRMLVAHYHEKDLSENILAPITSKGLIINGKIFPYQTYLHVAGHITSAYGTSPFAAQREDAYVLVWDGGMLPRLYHFNGGDNRVENLGELFPIMGNIYTMFAQYFDPYKVKGGFVADDSSLAGKVMAYIGKGKVVPELVTMMKENFGHMDKEPKGFYLRFVNALKQRMNGTSYEDVDILRSFHQFLEEVLVTRLIERISSIPKATRNLCLSGGCALNIKWNSALRSTTFFRSVYVPPFPNDSGSAIGAAVAARINADQDASIDWDVYRGPMIVKNQPFPGWTATHCPIPDLAKLLFEKGEPVVFLHGRTELGPRALGNRSIIGCPRSEKMKAILNQVKKRESYRPVSPICIETRAVDMFDPGTPDPFMLFDHTLRAEWVDRLPAVRHLDGSARLQTISENANPVMFGLLQEFEKLSGIPVLCNTSANLNGSGFFPDVYSATQWNAVNYVWCEQTLYVRDELLTF